MNQGDKGYFLNVDVQYPENLHIFHNDLPFLPEKMKIEKVEKPVANLHDKTEYVRNLIHINNLKQSLNHELLLKKLNRIIKFNQNGWLKPHIDINTELRKKREK